MWLKVTRYDSGIDMIINTDHISSISNTDGVTVINMDDDTMIPIRERFDRIMEYFGFDSEKNKVGYVR